MEIDIEQLRHASQGDGKLLGDLLGLHREQLHRVIRLRMDRRLQARVDASDVIQEAYIDATKRIKDYVADPKMPFFLWLRFLTVQKLAELHRRHLGVKARDANRELSLHQGPLPQATSAALAAHLIGRLTTASRAAMRDEQRLQLQDALNSMDTIDREILALRHYEQLSLREAAEVLEIKHAAACNRYVRAVKRLKELLAESSSEFEGMLE